MTPLMLIGKHNTSNAIISSNIETTIWRGYKALEMHDGDGPVSIVGAGPSLAKTYKNIKGKIIACNSAHDFLIEKGIVPDYAVIWDANPVMAGIIKPRCGVQYLLASRCHPSVFAKFYGYDVRVWHAMGDQRIEEILGRYGKKELLIGGGTASALRAIFLGMALGHKKDIHLHGVDSCYAANETHVSGSIVKQDRMHIVVCGRDFYVAPWMALQANDFKVLVQLLRNDGIKLTVHGDGLIPYCASFYGCNTPDIKVGWIERTRRPLHGLLALYTLLRKSPQLLGGNSYACI